MQGWINSISNDDYLEGDQPSVLHIPVVTRPDWTHDWDGQNWVQSTEKLAIQEETNKKQPTMKELVAALPSDIQAKLQIKLAPNVSAPL